MSRTFGRQNCRKEGARSSSNSAVWLFVCEWRIFDNVYVMSSQNFVKCGGRAGRFVSKLKQENLERGSPARRECACTAGLAGRRSMRSA